MIAHTPTPIDVGVSTTIEFPKVMQNSIISESLNSIFITEPLLLPQVPIQTTIPSPEVPPTVPTSEVNPNFGLISNRLSVL